MNVKRSKLGRFERAPLMQDDHTCESDLMDEIRSILMVSDDKVDITALHRIAHRPGEALE